MPSRPAVATSDAAAAPGKMTGLNQQAGCGEAGRDLAQERKKVKLRTVGRASSISSTDTDPPLQIFAEHGLFCRQTLGHS